MGRWGEGGGIKRERERMDATTFHFSDFCVEDVSLSVLCYCL